MPQATNAIHFQPVDENGIRRKIPTVMQNMINVQFRSFKCGQITEKRRWKHYSKIIFWSEIYSMRTSNGWKFHAKFIASISNSIQTSLHCIEVWLNSDFNSYLHHFTKILLAPPRDKTHSIRRKNRIIIGDIISVSELHIKHVHALDES